MTPRWMTIFYSALLAGASVQAHAAGRADVVRDLAGRVGPIIGSASACRLVSLSNTARLLMLIARFG